MIYLLFLPAVHAESALIQTLPWEDYLLFSFISLLLVLFGGCMSGLTVGLMSIDELELEMKLASGTEIEREQALKVLNIINRHHLLLVTLLVANAVAMEALPIFLDYMFSTVLAVSMSVTFVLFFGEVLPQALCTGPDQIRIASKLVPIVRVVMVIFFPISWPISKVLDCVFGDHPNATRFKREELKTLVSLHTSQIIQESQSENALKSNQIKIIHGAIDMVNETVGSSMISIDKIFSLSEDTILTDEMLHEILDKGFSRIPIYSASDPTCIRGVMMTKKLICTHRGVSVKNSGIKLRDPLFVSTHLSLDDLLTRFREGKSHIAFVSHEDLQSLSTENSVQLGILSTSRICGLITLEDVISKILDAPIIEEDDYDKTIKNVAYQLSRTLTNSKKEESIRPMKKVICMKTLSLNRTDDYSLLPD
jgi:metal transporter CNNM